VIGTSFIYGLLKKSRPAREIKREREREKVDSGNASADIPFTKTNSNVRPVDRGDKGIVLILSRARTNERERSERLSRWERRRDERDEATFLRHTDAAEP